MTDTQANRPQGSNPDIPASTEAEEDELISLFVFRLAESLYAVDATTVDHVAPAEQPLPVPTAPAHFLGIVHLRGRIVTVVDMPALLGLGAGSDQDSQEDQLSRRLVVLQDHARPFGFLADGVLGLSDVPLSQIRPCQADTEPTFDNDNLLRGHFELRGGVASVLDLAVVVSTLTGGDSGEVGPQ